MFYFTFSRSTCVISNAAKIACGYIVIIIKIISGIASRSSSFNRFSCPWKIFINNITYKLGKLSQKNVYNMKFNFTMMFSFPSLWIRLPFTMSLSIMNSKISPLSAAFSRFHYSVFFPISFFTCFTITSGIAWMTFRSSSFPCTWFSTWSNLYTIKRQTVKWRIFSSKI